MSSSPDNEVTRPLRRADLVAKREPRVPSASFFPTTPATGMPALQRASNAKGASLSSGEAKYPLSGQFLPTTTQPVTGSLASDSKPVRTVTGHLLTTTQKPRAMTVIHPSTRRKKPPKPLRQPKRPILLTSILCVSVATLLLALLIARPLDLGTDGVGIQQTISTIFSSGSFTAFSPEQHFITPSPVPPSLIDEGQCGDASIWGTCAGETTTSGVIGTGQMESPLKDEGAIISQPFDVPEYQYWCGCYRPHSGIDLAAPFGAEVKASDSGEVIWVGWDDTGLGYGVKISHGNYVATIYGHLYRYIVQVGSVVHKGDVIGYEGSTGQSTGPHVHFMVLIYNRWVNPADHMALP